MKGHNIYGGNGGTNTIRGRQLYAIMLILAFGAAIMGAMLLHKYRERRIYTILVKEKDHQLISLHLLLQKERNHIKEAKRKIQEMKAKIYSVRTQKVEFDSKISEMHSTILSLKEEQRTLETSLEEKQNEIKFLRAKETEPQTENTKTVSLTDTFKQKEYPTKIWSVSTDDPSNLASNSTNNFQNQVEGHEIANERNGDEIEGTKSEGVTLNGVKGSNETDAKIANEEPIENLSLHGNDESQQIENESIYTNDTSAKRLRVHAKQQRRGGVIRHRRSFPIQHNGKYKRIVDQEMQKLGMSQDEVETGRNKKVKHELGRNSNMGTTEKIGGDKHVEKRLEFSSANESVEKMQRNDTVNGETELSEENVDGVQVQVETNDDETGDRSTEEEKTSQKNEENETEGDYGEFKAEQEEGKVGSGGEKEDIEF